LSFDLLILGTSAAVQANGRHQSAQILKKDKHLFLIDCGEGTQEQLRRRKVNLNKISKIFISHLHGDHFFGLFGLISTMSLQGREKRMEIYGPKGLNEILTLQLRISQSIFNFPIEYKELNSENKNLIFEDDSIEVFSFPLNHGIECCGFLFQEKPKQRKVHFDKLPQDIDNSYIKLLKKGFDITLENGDFYKNEDYTFDPQKSSSYAYCSDTAYSLLTSTFIQGVDVLYHESTFLNAQQDKAVYTNHSTTSDAARVALESNTKMLIIGHFSARYSEESLFEQEAKMIFENTQVAVEGRHYSI
jgi:ribonuclease Z